MAEGSDHSGFCGGVMVLSYRAWVSLHAGASKRSLTSVVDRLWTVMDGHGRSWTVMDCLLK